MRTVEQDFFEAPNVNQLAIKDVAERTGLAAGTIRAWEQRYGFPQPRRTATGYRRYSEEDVRVLLTTALFRERGLSVGAALERALETDRAAERSSIYAAVAGETPHRSLRKSTLVAISNAIEDEALARSVSSVCFGTFQEEAFYRAAEHRYQRLAQVGDEVVVFADFPRLRIEPGHPTEVPLASDDALNNEWVVVIDAPDYAACLLAWEPPVARGTDDDARRFESIWTTDPKLTRQASLVAARLAARADAELGQRLEAVLTDRPVAAEQPAPGLMALTHRIVGYLEAA